MCACEFERIEKCVSIYGNVWVWFAANKRNTKCFCLINYDSFYCMEKWPSQGHSFDELKRRMSHE